MGHRRDLQRLAVANAAAQAAIDAKTPLAPEPALALHHGRECTLLEVVDTGTTERAHIDRVTTGGFIDRIIELGASWGVPSGRGDFVDIGSGPRTANVVSYLSVVWPALFEAIHAVDLQQDLSTMVSVANIRRRVGGAALGVSQGMIDDAMKATCGITWWCVTDEKDPTSVTTSNAVGRSIRSSRIVYILARATFIFSCDLLFEAQAIDVYRREIARSLIDGRQVLYVSCHPIGERHLPRTAPEAQWVHANGTDDPHIGPYVRHCAKLVAKGGGVDVAWEDTTFYLAVLAGPNTSPEVRVAHASVSDVHSAVHAAESATTAAVHQAYAESKRQVDALGGGDGASAAAAAAAAAIDPPGDCGELTEQGMSKLVQYMYSSLSIDECVTDSSRILDVGSGLGKGVLNFAIRAPAARSITGVEPNAQRHAVAVDTVDALRTSSAMWRARLQRVILTQADVATSAFNFDQYTHVFMFNFAFDDATLRALFARIAASPSLVVLACFSNDKTLRAHGWPMDTAPVEMVHKERVATTHMQRFTCSIYRRNHDSE